MATTSPEVAAFTPELVSAGANRAHTYESWGRAVIAEALRRAAKSDEFRFGWCHRVCRHHDAAGVDSGT